MFSMTNRKLALLVGAVLLYSLVMIVIAYV